MVGSCFASKAINCYPLQWDVQFKSNYFRAIIHTEMKDEHTDIICAYKQKFGPYLTTVLGPPCTNTIMCNNLNLNP